MFEPSESSMNVTAFQRLTSRLGRLQQDVDDSVRIDRIRALEELKAAAAAAQAQETAAFVRSQRAEQAAVGVPEDRANRGIALQVALARRISHHQAQRYVGWSMLLTSELPRTYEALRAGRVPESRALLVARETIWLSRNHRREVDAELGPQLEQLGDKRLEAAAKSWPTGWIRVGTWLASAVLCRIGGCRFGRRRTRDGVRRLAQAKPRRHAHLADRRVRRMRPDQLRFVDRRAALARRRAGVRHLDWVGAAGTAAVGMFWLGEGVTVLKVVSIAFIVGHRRAELGRRDAALKRA